ILRHYGWPGNVRELRNVIERAVILCRGERIDVHHLPENLRTADRSIRLGDPLRLDRIEEEHIRRVLADTRSLQEAADILGIDQATLWRRRKQYGI
ncbi:MAG: sigma-54-dependent Fis family transcriptional regulator, partial [Deltaproteobacteria bacterium]|nr:sigma-54-dependent Fis family transcriptional regulator [Deltaproteobacteria bacterium]